jgi:SAM-dependent methyltransferase
MNNPLIYLFWQAPFAHKKFAPIAAMNELKRVKRVLDVGCGPGTNTHYFQDKEYLGIDINASYIKNARKRYVKNFIVADASTFTVPQKDHFDFILVNSFLHHIDIPSTRRVLSQLNTLLTKDGHVHIIDLVYPETPGPARIMAKWDRGKYSRPLLEWKELFTDHFELVEFHPYPLVFLGMSFWNMIYFKGKKRVDHETGTPLCRYSTL